ncbi:uncharacterized protein LTR77_007933 [Saxophila tyrrhenica]|uniref:Uncharacterized protein n=1 Tax=Saxophila tyrrhenica TaxID=1690608 RepID=A0AAV9P6S3_9PEZI|nr:hypothetical protein LTR77_007933 [Saxophila tyrrhenica]
MFCFSRGAQFRDTLSHLPADTIQKIQRLSVLEVVDWTRDSYELIFLSGWSRDLVPRLKNLVEVELPPEWLRDRSLEYLSGLKHLRKVRATSLLPEILGHERREEENSIGTIWIRVEKDLIPGPCRQAAAHQSLVGPQLGKNSCFFCWGTGEDAWNHSWATGMRAGSVEVPEVIRNTVQRRLMSAYRELPLPAHGVRDGVVEKLARQTGMEITLHGLPVLSATARKPLRAAKKRELQDLSPLVLSNARRVRAQESVPVDFDELEGHLSAKERSERSMRQKKFKDVTTGKEEIDRTVVLIERQCRRHETAKQEKVDDKDQSKEARKKALKSAADLSVSKKSERKRVRAEAKGGRNGSG